jgi:hypothetical protein
MTDPADTHDLTIGEFEQAVQGLTWDDLAAAPLANLTIDDLNMMTTEEFRETLRRA